MKIQACEYSNSIYFLILLSHIYKVAFWTCVCVTFGIWQRAVERRDFDVQWLAPGFCFCLTQSRANGSLFHSHHMAFASGPMAPPGPNIVFYPSKWGREWKYKDGAAVFLWRAGGSASRMCHPGRFQGPPHAEGPVLSLILDCYHFEILNNVFDVSLWHCGNRGSFGLLRTLGFEIYTTSTESITAEPF